MPIEAELSSLRVSMQPEKNGKEMLKQRILDLERLALSREDAMGYYVKQGEERKKKFNANLSPKNITEGSLGCATTIDSTTTRVTSSYHTGKGRLKLWRSLTMEATSSWMLLELCRRQG